MAETFEQKLKRRLESQDPEPTAPGPGDSPRAPTAPTEPVFFALARALFLNHGQDSSLALALVAWGEEHEPLAVKFIAANVGDMDKVRRGLGGLFRAAVKVCPDDVAFWVAEDKESWETLRPYIEKKDAPDLYRWIDEFKKFRLDRADLRVIDHIRDSDAIEREAIRQFG